MVDGAGGAVHGLSALVDPVRAVREASHGFDTRGGGFVLAFAPDRYDPHALAAALKDRFGPLPVHGAITPGRVGPSGYDRDELLLMFFPSACCEATAQLIRPLSDLGLGPAAGAVATLRERPARRRTRVALLFADYRPKKEDLLAATLETALHGVPVFGGSVGAGEGRGPEAILHGGTAHADAALVLMIETDYDVTGLGFTHVQPTTTQMVVTEALPEERIVREINGAPAALEYARLVGVAPEDLGPRVFAENPTLMRQNGSFWVRAPAQVHPGGELGFLCSVDDGQILTLGRGIEAVGALETGLDLAGPNGARPRFVFALDCILRRLEIEQKGLGPRVGEVFAGANVIGINTYGEQYRGVHLNQTFVGLAFYPPGEGPSAE